MLRARRPQGHSKKRPHRNGWSGSQPIENARDGLRPLGTTAHNATRARLRFGHIAGRTRSAPPRDRGPAQKALRAISSTGEVAAWALAIDALGTIPGAFLASEPNIADGIRERRAGTNIVGVIALNTATAGAAFGPA